MDAHGDDNGSSWVYASGSHKVLVEDRLAHITAGGAVLMVCNPGRYALRSVPFPVIYPLGDIVPVDINFDEIRLVPEGTAIEPEKSLKIVNRFLDSSLEQELRREEQRLREENRIREIKRFVQYIEEDYTRFRELARSGLFP